MANSSGEYVVCLSPVRASSRTVCRDSGTWGWGTPIRVSRPRYSPAHVQSSPNIASCSRCRKVWESISARRARRVRSAQSCPRMMFAASASLSSPCVVIEGIRKPSRSSSLSGVAPGACAPVSAIGRAVDARGHVPVPRFVQRPPCLTGPVPQGASNARRVRFAL